MHAVTTNGNKSQVSKDESYNLEVCNQVQEVFQKQVPDKNGFAERKKFAQMLEALGLTNDEALLLMNECDPSSKSRLPYTDFLDFIFGKTNGKTAADVKVDDKVDIGETVYDSSRGDQTRKASDNVPRPDLSSEPEPSDPSTEKDTARAPSKEETSSRKPSKEESSKVQALLNGSFGAVSKGPVKPGRDASKESVQKPAGESKPAAGSNGSEADCSRFSSKESVRTLLTNPCTTGTMPEMKKCNECKQLHAEVFIDPTDSYQYCESCWMACYNSQPKKLVNVVKGKQWSEDKLLLGWSQNPIPGWGYRPFATRAVTAATGDPTDIGDHFFPVHVRLNPGLVGTHARNCTTNSDRSLVGEKLCNRYRVEKACGAGHFTRALLAVDEETGRRVCVKKHNSLTLELLTDLLTVCRRLQSEDKENKYFPQMFDAFYDIEGFTVESLVPGKNCLALMRENKEHFKKFDNLKVVAQQGYTGLVYMARAGVVHCDLKPDNIMWVDPTEPNEEPRVILVDFGCSRLDSRLENGRNWALSECGAGHVGKWAPEMILRLPITHKADVWGLAVALLELHCGRTTWCGEADTVEIILAQVLGLVNARNGVPQHLLKQSPLDIRQLYTPRPSYFPVQRFGTFGRGATFQEWKPATWGLGCVLGAEETWDEIRIIFANFILAALNLDPAKRPSAEWMLTHAYIEPDAEENAKILEDWKEYKEAEKAAAEAAAAEPPVEEEPPDKTLTKSVSY